MCGWGWSFWKVGRCWLFKVTSLRMLLEVQCLNLEYEEESVTLLKKNKQYKMVELLRVCVWISVSKTTQNEQTTEKLDSKKESQPWKKFRECSMELGILKTSIYNSAIRLFLLSILYIQSVSHLYITFFILFRPSFLLDHIHHQDCFLIFLFMLM